jgi:hypothetical protein
LQNLSARHSLPIDLVAHRGVNLLNDEDFSQMSCCSVEVDGIYLYGKATQLSEENHNLSTQGTGSILVNLESLFFVDLIIYMIWFNLILIIADPTLLVCASTVNP